MHVRYSAPVLCVQELFTTVSIIAIEGRAWVEAKKDVEEQFVAPLHLFTSHLAPVSIQLLIGSLVEM